MNHKLLSALAAITEFQSSTPSKHRPHKEKEIKSSAAGMKRHAVIGKPTYVYRKAPGSQGSETVPVMPGLQKTYSQPRGT
jgi:hypothetical protein